MAASGPSGERRSHRPHNLNRLIPNALTLLALCAGVTAIRFAIHEDWDKAVIAVIVAAVLDGLDGRIARALSASSLFGAELDSLSDFVSFGVAPALIVYLWSLQHAGGLGWALALLFAVTCALRLARYNAQLDQAKQKPSWMQNYFIGVPAPAAGGLALWPLICSIEAENAAFASPVLNSLVILGVSALMVSRVPTYAAKRVRVPPRYVVFVLLGLGAFIAFMLSTPWLTMALAGVAYMISIPLAWFAYRRQARKESRIAVEEIEDEEETIALSGESDL